LRVGAFCRYDRPMRTALIALGLPIFGASLAVAQTPLQQARDLRDAAAGGEPRGGNAAPYQVSRRVRQAQENARFNSGVSGRGVSGGGESDSGSGWGGDREDTGRSAWSDGNETRDQGSSYRQAPSGPPHELGVYTGVTPGTSGSPPRAEAARRTKRHIVVTWPGFQARPDGASRFFLQSTAPLVTEVLNEPGKFVLLLSDSAVHLENTRRSLDTRFFNTPVNWARIERRRTGRRRHDLALVLDMRGDITPVVTTEQGPDGYSYVFFEFPSGNFAPPPPPPPEQGTVPRSTSSGVTTDELDRERPPPVQR